MGNPHCHHASLIAFDCVTITTIITTAQVIHFVSQRDDRDSRQLLQKFGSWQISLLWLLLLAVDETADQTLELLTKRQLLVRPDDGVRCAHEQSHL